MKADCYDSASRHGRRARRISTGTIPSAGTIREQLLRSGQLHQGCTTDDAEKEQWTYFDIDGYKLVRISQPEELILI